MVSGQRPGSLFHKKMGIFFKALRSPKDLGAKIMEDDMLLWSRGSAHNSTHKQQQPASAAAGKYRLLPSRVSAGDSSETFSKGGQDEWERPSTQQHLGSGQEQGDLPLISSSYLLPKISRSPSSTSFVHFFQTLRWQLWRYLPSHISHAI